MDNTCNESLQFYASKSDLSFQGGASAVVYCHCISLHVLPSKNFFGERNCPFGFLLVML